ncbi:MAG: potassium channel family protein [Desulfatibacillaceae bacterium]
MRIGVVGLGHFGMHVARELYQNGFDVLALDRNRDLVQHAQQFSTKAVVADCTVKEVLADLGFGELDYTVVSLGENLAASVLATMHLKELGVDNITVKAAGEDHGKVLSRIGASRIVYPEREAAVKLARGIISPNVLDYLPVTEDFAVMEVKSPREFLGKSIAELDLRRKYGIQVIAVKDTYKDEVSIMVSPDEKLNDWQRLVVMGKNEDIEKIKGMTHDS